MSKVDVDGESILIYFYLHGYDIKLGTSIVYLLMCVGVTLKRPFFQKIF